jgi:hypothetical protein
VFYGSSSFRLWATLIDDLAPWPVVNRAFGGSTLAACVHFFGRLVPPCRPGALTLYAGDNDLGDGQSADAVIASLEALLSRVDAQLGPIPLAFLAIKPSPARRALRPAILRVNQAAQHLLAARPRGLFIDTYYPMLGHDGEPHCPLFAEDGLHLIVQLARQCVDDVLAGERRQLRVENGALHVRVLCVRRGDGCGTVEAGERRHPAPRDQASELHPYRGIHGRDKHECGRFNTHAIPLAILLPTFPAPQRTPRPAARPFYHRTTEVPALL